MALSFPYTYYSCPCVYASAPLPRPQSKDRKASREQQNVAAAAPPDEDDGDEQTFDPKSPRANFSLFPLEHLLWCTECHEMRCARCMAEEIVCWYCPTCLFEVPSSTVRTEGNRCTRNCYNCPLCTSPLTVNTLEMPADTPSGDAVGGPFILSCSWCNWTSLDIGIKFEKHNNITGQLSRMRNGGKVEPTMKERESQVERLRREERSTPDPESTTAKDASEETDLAPDELFSRLTTFYRTQISEAWEPSLFGSYGASDMPFNSPGSISRLLNIYSGKKTKRQRPKPMREALTPAEGLRVFDAARDDGGDLARQRAAGWAGTTTTTQRAFQAPSTGLLGGGEGPRYVEDLRPAASQLRARRAKRCRACRTLLAKPEPRMSSSRWRIRVLALSYVPKLTLRTLDSTSSAALGASLAPQLVPLLAAAPPAAPAPLAPGAAHHFLLTVANPLFDPLRVTLATAPTTPGRVASRVTVLCPQFDVGANSDVWDEALSSSASAAGKRRSVAPGSASGAALGRLDEDVGGGGGQRQVEAGKVWARGRNWTSVIVEIVPGRLPPADELAEDEDVLEVAVFVRAEYETEAAAGEDKAAAGVGPATAGGAGGKETREVAFWSVLGAGMIGS